MPKKSQLETLLNKQLEENEMLKKEIEDLNKKMSNVEIQKKSNSSHIYSRAYEREKVEDDYEDEEADNDGNNYQVRGLPRSQPNFSGDVENEEVENWILATQINFKLVGTNEKHKVMSVVSYFKGSAFQVVMQAMKKNPDINWYQLCIILRKTFQIKKFDAHMHDRLMELKYNGDARSYGIKFNQLMNQADQAMYSEKVKIQMYRSNLSAELAREVVRMDPITLIEAMDAAESLEACENQSKKRIKSFNNKNSDIKFCFFCKKTGHVEAQCYKSKKENSEELAKTDMAQKSEKKYTCYRCNEPGHRSFECDNAKKVEKKNLFVANSDQLLTTECKILGKLMECVLDTGANTSIISEKVVKKLGIVPRDTNLLITIA